MDDFVEGIDILDDEVKIPGAIEDTYSDESQEELILKKCVRRGDKLYYPKQENINMLQNARKESYNKKSSFDAINQVDKVMSGESLYKAFTFQQECNDEDTEKCISFWESVLEKNLAPIKCTIIKSTTSKEPPETIIKKKSVVDNQFEVEEKLKNERAKIHDQYKSMWMNVLNNLQKKRLHELKLIGKSRCKICDSPLEEELYKVSTDEMQKEIAQLNHWSPKSQPIKERSAPKVIIRKTSIHESTNSSKASALYRDNSERKVSPLKPPEIAVVPEAPEVSVVPVAPVRPAPPKINVPPSKPHTNTYKHIDVIQEKKKSGAYSEWRTNMAEGPCPCRKPDCYCNKKPAIKSMEIPFDSKLEAQAKDATSEENLICTISDKNIKILDNKTKSDARQDKPNKSLSVMFNCTCSHSECDCPALKETLKKVSVDSPVMPPKPEFTRRPLVKVSSLEIIGRKFKSKESLIQRNESVDFSFCYEEEDRLEEHILETTDEEQTNEKPEKCAYGYDECDCGKTEEIKIEKMEETKDALLKKEEDTDSEIDPFKFPDRNENVDEVQLKLVDL